MSSEAELIISVWEAAREVVPHTKRADLSKRFMYAFAEYGFSASDLEEIVDEDADLAEAYQEVYLDEDEIELTEEE
jgi:hypothetical protein